MTKHFEYKKKSNVADLHKELAAAGFLVEGVSEDGTNTYVHLGDEETKDPTDIVNAHVGTPLKTPEELRAEEKATYAALLTDADRVHFIAKKMRLE